jgi:hypothetical protein
LAFLAVVAACAVGTLGVGATPSVAKEARSLSQLWRDVNRKGHYVAPSRAELLQAERLFLRSFRGGEDLGELNSAWNKLNFDLFPYSIDEEQILVLREKAGYYQGRGFYAFRHRKAVPTAIQAPHAFYDEHTRAIAARLFRESHVAATAWNTLHRSIADLAHSRDNYLDAFTRAFAAAHPTAMVVQIHGFAQEKRKSEVAARADLIISGGTPDPSRWLQMGAAVFRQRFGHGAVLLYPYEVSELGGTRNTQAAVLRSVNNTGFMHVEMSERLRRKLRSDQSVRREFLDALSRAYEVRAREN